MFTALSGCVKNNMETPVTTNTVSIQTPVNKPADSLNYLALGDSYTVGQSIPSNESFPYQLYSQLNGDGYPVTTPTIIATTGWTTDDLISAINRSGLVGQNFRFATLLIGVNDQYQHLSLDNYKVKFQQVLNTAIAFAHYNKNMVFVLSIPDYGVTPFAMGQDSMIGPQIDQFNAVNKQESLAAGVNYLDITAISRLAANDPTLIAGDGLHPSGAMYKMWVAQLAPMIVAQLKAGN